MRATALMFAAALLLLGQPLAAQTPEHAAAKEGQKSPAMRGRVGSVSPDEARRAERARKRAAAHRPKSEATKSEATKSEASKTETTKPVAAEAPKPIKTERAKTEPAKTEQRPAAAPTPVKEAARPRGHPDMAPAPPDREARAPRSRRVADRPHRERADKRHARIARARPDERPVRTRRTYVGLPPRWTPRVGATVPAGVPLYPVPGGYDGPRYVYGADALPHRWWYGPQPVYGAPDAPYHDVPDGGPDGD